MNTKRELFEAAAYDRYAKRAGDNPMPVESFVERTAAGNYHFNDLEAAWWGFELGFATAVLVAPTPVKMSIPPGPAPAEDAIYAEGWNGACDAFFGGKPAPDPVVITVTTTTPSDADMVLAAMSSGEWEVTRMQPSQWLTDEANREHAWIVKRLFRPFCSEARHSVRQWSAPTARAALEKAAKDLGLALPTVATS